MPELRHSLSPARAEKHASFRLSSSLANSLSDRPFPSPYPLIFTMASTGSQSSRIPRNFGQFWEFFCGISHTFPIHFRFGFPANFDLRVGSPDHKGTQGQVEVRHKLVMRQLKALLYECINSGDRLMQARWPEFLSRAVAQLNGFPSSETGVWVTWTQLQLIESFEGRIFTFSWLRRPGTCRCCLACSAARWAARIQRCAPCQAP